MSGDIDSELLARYLGGMCSAAEEAQVAAWMEEDPARLDYVRRLQKAWMISGERPRHWDTDAAWNSLARRTGIATPANTPPAPSREERGPLVRRRRTPSDRPSYGRRGRARTGVSSAFVLAAVATLVVLASLVAVELEQDTAPKEKVFVTKRGQRATLELVDGTQVRLNADSRLTVSAGYSTDQRDVRLQGEAYFKVARDIEHPFRVRAGDAVVQVLGTEFNVRAYAQEPSVESVVAEGRVSMRAEAEGAEEGVVLLPRQLGTVASGTTEVTRRNVALDRYLAWIEGRLVFEAAPFHEVASELERWYDITIELTVPVARVDRLHATFSDESLSEVLDIIAAALDLEYQRTGSRIEFSPLRPSPS